jgi:hypothetical protein
VSQLVWISGMMADSELVLMVSNDMGRDNPEKFQEALRLLRKGQPVPAEMCPNRIWVDKDIKDLTNVPDLFSADGYYTVSERAANILGQFDLGGGALYPVREGVYGNDNQTRIPGEYFTWVFGNVKTAFLPEVTPEKLPFGVAGIRWNMPVLMKDGDIAVSSAALEGPNVWMEPNLMRSVFLSGPLGQALSDGGLAKAFRLKTCRVI